MNQFLPYVLSTSMTSPHEHRNLLKWNFDVKYAGVILGTNVEYRGSTLPTSVQNPTFRVRGCQVLRIDKMNNRVTLWHINSDINQTKKHLAVEVDDLDGNANFDIVLHMSALHRWGCQSGQQRPSLWVEYNSWSLFMISCLIHEWSKHNFLLIQHPSQMTLFKCLEALGTVTASIPLHST